MKHLGSWKIIACFVTYGAMYAWQLVPANAQAAAFLESGVVVSSSASLGSPCTGDWASLPVKQALRLVCQRNYGGGHTASMRKAIVIGFVGGFVKSNDVRHPEVHFAALLRDRDPAVAQAEVFSNHDGKKARARVLQLLDTDGDGTLSSAEKEQANIVIYGHSWGGSQTVTLARELGKLGVPVLLTIQLDSVRKPGQDDSTIPDNVENAVNFYQPRGLIHGRSVIRAADPTRTNILGNVRMAYARGQINCDNYPWLPRVFNRPHHQIENDPRVWDQVVSLIDSELTRAPSIAGASSTPQ
jgi:pimeloyl-ACP methyl ester carboxylesterase